MKNHTGCMKWWTLCGGQWKGGQKHRLKSRHQFPTVLWMWLLLLLLLRPSVAQLQILVSPGELGIYDDFRHPTHQDEYKAVLFVLLTRDGERPPILQFPVRQPSGCWTKPSVLAVCPPDFAPVSRLDAEWAWLWHAGTLYLGLSPVSSALSSDPVLVALDYANRWTRRSLYFY